MPGGGPPTLTSAPSSRPCASSAACDQPRRGVRVGEVGGDAGAAQLLGGAADAALVAGGQHHARALGDEHAGGGQARARGSRR